MSIDVDEVTLMEDRARVIRRGTVELPAGLSRVTIAAVSPVLADKTLAARSPTATVTDASVARRRLHLDEDRDEATQALVAQRRDARERVDALSERLRRIEDSLGQLDDAASHTLDELALDAAWSRADAGDWERRLKSVAELEGRLREERLTTRWDLEEARRELERVQRALSASATPSRELRAQITVTIEAPEAGPHAIEVEYVVPNACWRPRHRAVLDGDTVRFEHEGCVWQNTGEDWDDVQLRFSTQRPSLGVEPPTLSTDRLRVQRKADRVVVEARQQVVEQTGLGAASAPAAPELPGIDDGGEVQELVAPDRARVPSDGRPHRAALFAFEVPATETLSCVPSITEAVIRKTEQTNEATRPLLAGPVDLVRGGGFVGRTTILYVAPGERFELGWGPDPALRVHREVEVTEEESKLLSSWYRSERDVVDRLSNLGPDPKTVELVERVPVSEIEKVKIAVDADHTGRDADADGFVRWSVELAPFGHERVELRYVVERHSDVSGSF